MTEQSSPAYEGFPATADNPNDGRYEPLRIPSCITNGMCGPSQHTHGEGCVEAFAVRNPSSGTYAQAQDGTWQPLAPLGWQEEHGWLARFVFWLRRVEHCNDREGQRRGQSEPVVASHVSGGGDEQ